MAWVIFRRIFLRLPLFAAKAYVRQGSVWGSSVMYELSYVHPLVLRLKSHAWRLLRDKWQKLAQFAELQVDMKDIQVHHSDMYSR